ncbi:MAG: UDP-N-acetylmuramoyl-tripeptide--D-alanyl-D-alanine ligase [bacterium]
MKSFIKKIIQNMARMVINKFQPGIVAITGNVGKTSTKDAIALLLSSRYRVEASRGNYNNEFGVPLTILGKDSPGSSPLGWLRVLLRGLRLVLWSDAKYPEILVLEYAIDHPKDMDVLLSIAKPNVAVITPIGEAPSHLEFFDSLSDLVAEKVKLIKALSKDGLAVLSADDKNVKRQHGKTKARVLTYGMDREANFYASNFIGGESETITLGLNFKVEFSGNTIPVKLPKVLSKFQAVAVAAALAVGTHFDINLVESSKFLESFTPPKGRMNVLPGIKGTTIIDDSYNSSPKACAAALEVLGEQKAIRKIAVLGDMKELGEKTEEAHEEIVKMAEGVADIVITVGDSSKFISESANHFDAAEEAGRYLQDEVIKAGDIILVKASQSIRLEKVVKELMLHPEKAKELLVRQGEEWNKD